MRPRGILNRGRLVESGRLSEILKTRSNEIEVVVSGVNEEILAALASSRWKSLPRPKARACAWRTITIWLACWL